MTSECLRFIRFVQITLNKLLYERRKKERIASKCTYSRYNDFFDNIIHKRLSMSNQEDFTE